LTRDETATRIGGKAISELDPMSSAVVTEVTALSKYIMGAIEVCIELATGKRHVPQTDATYIVRKLFAPPTVYNAMADRIGLLPHPDATTQFYMRLEEVKAATSAIEMAVKFQWAPGMGPPPLITRDIIAPVADMLITALQLAKSIIADAKSGPPLERRIREITVNQIEECFVAAKQAFPTRSHSSTYRGHARPKCLFDRLPVANGCSHCRQYSC
jgi:hypothetical protein